MCLRPLGRGAHVEDRLLEVGAIDELLEVEEVAMLADAVERLVERRQPLLAVEHEEGVLRAVERRCALELAAAKTRLASRTRRMLPAG